eukprot:CAMPEP_0113562370 /NCGR_PEP_ID=MMETSP0015_2-20120614/20487_1 /TAXON_ID=2838 /ORGANISM="Odontella" /LENGTH=150 /DNA_ID=CAMNT_0000464255 /DNA_START=255 /DNA_END=704 /DNA_ORIENTATION=- /assembly_acc=CAM_ASM_000160
MMEGEWRDEIDHDAGGGGGGGGGKEPCTPRSVGRLEGSDTMDSTPPPSSPAETTEPTKNSAGALHQQGQEQGQGHRRTLSDLESKNALRNSGVGIVNASGVVVHQHRGEDAKRAIREEMRASVAAGAQQRRQQQIGAIHVGGAGPDVEGE